MRNAIVGLTFASLLFGAAGTAFAAAGDRCTPHKPGYVLDASGKCVKAPAVKPQQ